MSAVEQLQQKISEALENDPAICDYFALITELVQKKHATALDWRYYVEQLYAKVYEEIVFNEGRPVSTVSFGTSGWRGILGKDLFCKSVAQVALAIVEMYRDAEVDEKLRESLGVADFAEVCRRGCVIGFDNRFCGDILAGCVVNVFKSYGIKVFYAGESTTGVLSAAVLQCNAAFSINFTPSHNPLEYGGLKFNAADAGPAAAEVTRCITAKANEIIASNRLPSSFAVGAAHVEKTGGDVEKIDSFGLWQQHVTGNVGMHGLEYKSIIDHFQKNDDVAVVIDSVHGASRLHIKRFFLDSMHGRVVHLRDTADVTFGGVAPEPSSENMISVVATLQARPERLKLGAIIDPDGDRIRFTDGSVEIGMNQFGAMAYHFLHEIKGKKGMVAKTVASSNLANAVAEKMGESVFEPRVGFKEFKPVIHRALVCFEESDGITIIGHTPEKDAYIGLLLALDMIMTTGKNLSEYLLEIESRFGSFYPGGDSVAVSLQGEELLEALAGLEKYDRGTTLEIGGEAKTIAQVIAIDGRKILFEDGSWLMIRPSGTEPKVRFYVESRTADGTEALIQAAQNMLKEIGLLV